MKGGKWCYLQTTDGEDSNQSRLLSVSKLQTSDHGHREENDDKVRYDVDGRVGEPHGELIDAACGLLSPESLYRYAREDAAEDGPDGVANDYGKHAPAQEPKLSGRKHSMVLKEDRALGQSE